MIITIIRWRNALFYAKLKQETLDKGRKRYRIPSEETELTRREFEKYERDLQAWRETH